MTQSEIRVVCFDLGGVLVKVARDWEHACRFAQLDLKPADRAWEKQHALMCQLERGQITEAQYFDQVRHCELGVSEHQLKCAFDAWLQGAYPGAIDLIDELKDRGIQTACLSNTNERHWRQLMHEVPEYAEVMCRLDHRFASQLIGEAKPQPRIYSHAQAKLGAYAAEILFFDDRLDNVEGARRAGWNAERITADDAIAQERAYLQKYGVL